MKGGIIFGLGVLTGGAIATGATIVVLKRKVNKEKDEEIEEVRRYYKEKCKKCDRKPVTLESTEDKNEAEKDESLTEKVGLAERNTADVGRKMVEGGHTDYTKFSKLQEKYTGKSAKEMFQMPHDISEDDFDNDPDYDKVILTYYESDDIMADISDNISEYTAEDFGYENLKDFGFEGIKYLRNEKSKTDFKIIYEGTISYDQATGGRRLNDP